MLIKFGHKKDKHLYDFSEYLSFLFYFRGGLDSQITPL